MEIITVVSHVKHINTICGQIAWHFSVKVVGTFSYHCALKG
jgi:hypothetical protein